jgi:iduronate 2-sulfatase
MARIAATILALVLFSISFVRAANEKPNVLLICVDDLKPMLGCYGDTTIKSPNIDRLAARGMRFDRAYCNQAVCAPSRNALLTGLRPQTIGIYDLGTNFRKAVPDAVTLPQYFKAHGYHTEGLGKVFHSGHGNHDDAASWSIPHWNANIVHYALPENRSANSQSREAALFASARVEDAKELPRGAAYESADVPDNAYPDGLLADEAIRRLQTAAKSTVTPFFIAVGFLKPHLPFCAPKKYWDLYDPAGLKLAERRTPPDGAPPFAPTNWGELRNYANMPEKGPVADAIARKLIHGYHAAVSFSDAQIGRVLEALDKNGLAKNTIIVLWGDHGWHLGDHGMWCKHTNYEEAAHIPLLVIDSRTKHGAAHTSAIVESVDIYPTLCELAGLPVPTGLDGSSFASALEDSAAKTKDAALHVYPRGKLLGRSVRTARYRLVEWKEPGASRSAALLELYDYESDPGENKNLAAEKPEVVNELRAILDEQPEAKPQLEKAQAGKRAKSAKQGKDARPKNPNKRRARSDANAN